MGSSSAVTVGLLNALHTYLGDSAGAYQLAQEACKIEIDILGKPIGVQDQYACALGGFRAIYMQSDGIRGVTIPIRESVMEDLNNSMMLLYTNRARKSEKILSTLKKDKKVLDLNKELAKTGIEYLTEGSLKQFGELLHEYWEAKKTLSGRISNSYIDDMYKTARNAGVIGGKIIGAGGGGFLLLLYQANKRAQIRRSLLAYKELPFRFSETGSRVIFNV